VDDEELLAKLEQLAEAIGITVRYEDTEGRSGSAVLRGQKVAVVDAGLSLRGRIEALAAILAREDTEGMYLPPAVRALLETDR
jgi:hypothetical protein